MAVVSTRTILVVLSLVAMVLASGDPRTCKRRYGGCVRNGKPTEECKSTMYTCLKKYCLSHTKRTTRTGRDFGRNMLICYVRNNIPLNMWYNTKLREIIADAPIFRGWFAQK
ncbi:hypothetical protein ScPMuIL_017797 [Solemya velum]